MRSRIIILINAGTLAAAVCRHLEASPRPAVVMVPDPPPPRLDDETIAKAIHQISFTLRNTAPAADSFASIAESLQMAYRTRATPNQPFYAPFLRRPRRRR